MSLFFPLQRKSRARKIQEHRRAILDMHSVCTGVMLNNLHALDATFGVHASYFGLTLMDEKSEHNSFE